MPRFGYYPIAAALAFAATGAALADVRAGVEAYQRGDYARALAEWRPLADKGDPDAQFNLAQVYKLGRGVPASLDTAIGWYRKAALQNHAEAEALLGLLLFQNGKRAEAMPWLSKAADRGDSASQYVYGTALFNGDMVKTDWPRAYSLMTQAAAQGLPPARSALQEMDTYIPLDQRQQGAALARAATEGRASPGRTAAAGVMPSASTPVGRTANNYQLPRASAPARAPASSQTPKPDGGPPPRPAVGAPIAVAARPATPPRAVAARPAAARPMAAKPAPAPARMPGGWKVQLGAFAQPSNANALFASLKKRVGALSGAQAILVRAGPVTRLQAGPFASRAAAANACAGVKEAGQACFPVAP